MAVPSEAPVGVAVRLFPRPPSIASWATWLSTHPTGTYWENRKVIRPRLILIHTNGASREGTKQAAYNVAMAAQDTTKPTYQVDRDGTAVKFLPSDRQGIANYLADPFSISIETADLGYPTPGETEGFTDAQRETICQIVAYEAKLWDIPISTPALWNGEGVAGHTDPFTYPYWTKYPGKVCPGAAKKAEIRELILPRVRDILDGPDDPIPVPPTGDDMQLAVLRMVNTVPKTDFLGYAELVIDPTTGDLLGHKFWKVLWIDGANPQAMKMYNDQLAGGAKVHEFGEHVSVSLYLENRKLPTSTHADGRPWATSDWGYTNA